MGIELFHSHPQNTLTKDEHQLGLKTLYSPPNGTAEADVIFIHGLEGGSIKDWSFSDSCSRGELTVCWPRDLLPADHDFGKQARLHTFGYDSNWTQHTPSEFSVHGFAQSLLRDMKNHRQMREGRTGIIFVGHGLGGCIAKETYILARQDPSCSGFSRRIHSMVFLATPHGGPELGQSLQNLLLLAGVEQKHAEKLVANARPMRQMNEDFRRYAPDLRRIYTYFESLPMPHYHNKLIVGKECTHLNFPNEEVSYLDSAHDGVCRFSNASNSDYRRVRNALAVAIERGQTH